MAKSQEEINVAAQRFYKRVFLAETTPGKQDLRQMATEEFDLPLEMSDEQMRSVIRVLFARFYEFAGVRQIGNAKSQTAIMDEYIQSLRDDENITQ